MGGYTAALGMSTATGITSDALGAVPVTKHGDAHATLVDGTVIQPGSGTTPRQHLFTSAAIVLVAAFILLGGARFLRNARIA